MHGRHAENRATILCTGNEHSCLEWHWVLDSVLVEKKTDSFLFPHSLSRGFFCLLVCVSAHAIPPLAALPVTAVCLSSVC
jgi:hypothetical protein